MKIASVRASATSPPKSSGNQLFTVTARKPASIAPDGIAGVAYEDFRQWSGNETIVSSWNPFTNEDSVTVDISMEVHIWLRKRLE